ncbi:hypothetical protein B0H16DRAFT_1311317 [Mycena metata]|uniref:Uncharacterized protein n=1 Tax=Mycena metata TaxID=1033252 RepID=A0AAD7JG62_9AGAR|nr:hypothetical protein B0H16DRAFT_1311317 [Mycena metata]
MPASHAQENAEIILALTRMGIYMERDRTKLDLLSASAQNSRLRKALDRAVENCCIFPLMFPEKEDREMGKLVVSNLPEWEGWRLPRKWEEGSRDQQSISEQLARVIHFVDRPNSCGILLQKQTGIVGSSIVMSNPLKSSGFGENPFGNVNNTAIFEAVVNIIKRSDNEKDKAAYFWATRKGDCLEVDLVDLPDQSLGW